MSEFLTIEYATNYGVELKSARHLTDEERRHILPEYQDTTFVGVGSGVKLEYIKHSDMPDRPYDGSFMGCNNQTWIITQAEWDEYVTLNNIRKSVAEAEAIQDEIDALEARKAAAERQQDLPSAEEAARRVKAWNDLYNEGGEGYVPHIYSAEEYEHICSRLAELKKQA